MASPFRASTLLFDRQTGHFGKFAAGFLLSLGIVLSLTHPFGVERRVARDVDRHLLQRLCPADGADFGDELVETPG